MNIMPTYDHIMITIRTENKNDHLHIENDHLDIENDHLDIENDHLDIENDHLDIENAYVIEVQIDAKHK